MQHALAQEIKMRAPVHAALEEFEPVDLSLYLPVTPLHGDGGLDGPLVGPHAARYPLELPNGTRLCAAQPVIQPAHVVFAEDRGEFLHQGAGEIDVGARL